MTIEIEHRGYTIRYAENEDVWRCWDIDFSHAKLSTVKQRIDGLAREARKAAAIPAYRIGRDGDVSEASIIEIGDTSLYNERHVWWIGTKRGCEKPSRSKDALSEFAPQTPEADAAIERFKTLAAAARHAGREAEQARKAIPRLTEADLDRLLKAQEASA